MNEIHGKSILVRVCARFELSGFDCITLGNPAGWYVIPDTQDVSSCLGKVEFVAVARISC